jgi:hypothetical protein
MAMDIATSIRVKMAETRTTSAEVAALVDRSVRQVERWKAGESMPITVAQQLYAHGLLHEEALLGTDAA